MENSILNPDTVVFVISLLVLYWRLDTRSEDRVSALRDDLMGEIRALHARIDRLEERLTTESARIETTLRDENKSLEATLRDEIKSLEATLRDEIKGLEATLRDEIKTEAETLHKRIDSLESSLRSDIQFVENKVDRANQRLARLEGMLSLREADVELEPEA